jgi:hypothetical protein
VQKIKDALLGFWQLKPDSYRLKLLLGK